MAIQNETLAHAALVGGGQTTLHSHAGGSEAFPVGSVFLSVVATNPNTLLGYGTWSQIAQGQMLVGYKSGDSDFGTVEGTGGSKTATNVSVPATGASAVKAGSSASTAAANTHTHTISSINLLNPYFVVYVWKRTA